jgi:hypothetical protein
MVALFWLLVLGAGVVTGQPWAILILVVLVVCLVLANTHVPVDSQGRQIRKPRPAQAIRPPKPRAAKTRPALVPPKPPPPAPIVRDPWDEMRRLQQLQRKWRVEDHQSWDKEFNRLAKVLDPGP